MLFKNKNCRKPKNRFLLKLPFINSLFYKIKFINESKNIILLMKFSNIKDNLIINHLKEFKVFSDSEIDIFCGEKSHEELNHILFKIIDNYKSKIHRKIKKINFFLILFIIILFTPAFVLFFNAIFFPFLDLFTQIY
jgi:type II secretory pathway component PulF